MITEQRPTVATTSIDRMFPALRFQERRPGCLTDEGERKLLNLISALVSAGTSYFEDIFYQINMLAGDYRYEQTVSDLLNENVGILWEEYPHPKGGPGFLPFEG